MPLTESEHYCLELTAKLYRTMINEVIGHDVTRDFDIAELAAQIHVIQHSIMAQAAGRSHPDLYRTLGNRLPLPHEKEHPHGQGVHVQETIQRRGAI